MSDSVTASRIEPSIGARPLTVAPPPPDAAPPVPAPNPVAATPPSPSVSRPSTPLEQLARLEDKTARIEEKLARSEAATQRVVDRFEAASHRMSEVAQQSDLLAVRGEVKFIARRVRSLPGLTGLLLASVVTAVLTAAFTVAIIRYLPGLVGR